jgi:hypothetical protein
MNRPKVLKDFTHIMSNPGTITFDLLYACLIVPKVKVMDFLSAWKVQLLWMCSTRAEVDGFCSLTDQSSWSEGILASVEGMIERPQGSVYPNKTK